MSTSDFTNANGVAAWRRITLILPPGSPFPTIGEQWRRLLDGSIEAHYTRADLIEALQIANAIHAAQVEQASLFQLASEH